MLFFRVLQHLLPDGAAWRLTSGTTLRKLFEGLGASFEAAREFLDLAYLDLFPATTRELTEWELQFGLMAHADEAVRRMNVAAAWQATGGQSPRYLQDIVQAAGFELYVHEWWSSGPPYVARDPRDHTDDPITGDQQCAAFASQPQCAAFGSQPQCNNFLANNPGYLVNLDLSRRAPPAVPSDDSTWPFFLYWGGENFGEFGFFEAGRRAELEQLLLQLCPAQQWLVLMIGATLLTEAGDTLTTEADEELLATA